MLHFSIHMWKVSFDADGHRPIEMEHSCAPVMIESVFGDREKINPIGPPKFTSRERKAHASFDPFTTAAAEWTEACMYHYLANNPRRIPKLTDIEEMLIRKVGNAKLKCVFENDYHEDCVVWVSTSLI